MKMNRHAQLAILLCLYLQRSGRAQLVDICLELRLLPIDLSMVIDPLIAANIIKGDFLEDWLEMTEDHQVKEILAVFSEDIKIYRLSVEYRALGNYKNSIDQALKSILNRKISNINKELIANEVAMRERADHEGLEN